MLHILGIVTYSGHRYILWASLHIWGFVTSPGLCYIFGALWNILGQGGARSGPMYDVPCRPSLCILMCISTRGGNVEGCGRDLEAPMLIN